MEDSPWYNVPCDNTAFVFLTPNANTDSAAALVEKIFATHSLSVMREGELSCDTIKEEAILDVYYSAWSRFDKKTAAKSRHFQDVMAGFQKAMGGIGYTEAAKAGKIYNPTEACGVFKVTPKELYQMWKLNKNPEIVVTSGIVIKKFPQFDGKYIINGFFPWLRESLEVPGKYIRWWVVQWPERELEWYKFRDRVIGNKDLQKARSDSIRGVLAKEWKSLGLTVEPDLLENGVHGSGSPLEALSERIAFTGVPFEEDELGRVIKNRYAEFGMELATQWAVNNRISINDEPFRPAYDVCENFQTYDFLDTIEQNILNDEAYLKFRENQARAPWADYPFLDTEPEGIPLEIVWPYLIEDHPFKTQDFERNKLRKPRKPDLKAIKECEIKMNERNHAIARCLKLWPFLDQMPEGLSLATVIVYLVEDPEFKIFDQKRILLKKDPVKNAAAIKMFEEKMNERNHEVAKILKAWPFLHPMPEGIPLNIVLPHLVKDDEFKALDAERLSLLREPAKNAKRIKEIELAMDERNHVVARCLKGGWHFLDPFPEDIPLPTVIPYLKVDPEFLRLDRERLRLIDEDYFGNLKQIKEMEVKMNERSHVIAKILKRYPFLDTLPEGIPIDIVLPYLLKDKEFLDCDKDRLELHKDPAKNKADIKAKEVRMNERNHEIARALKAYPFLDPMPEGFVLAFVLTYLKQDPDFLRYDAERIALMKDPELNKDRIRELELLMDERNHAIARALKEWPFLCPIPHGMLLANVLPFLMLDEVFTGLDRERLALMADPTRNADKIKAVEIKMDERNHEVAKAMLEYAFLSQLPEGLTLATVLPHLKSSDPEFNSMDQQRRALIAKGADDEKTKAKIKEYEEKMNVRNHTMAIILKDYQFLDKVPEGLPLATVFPYLREDPKFKRFDKERKWLRRNPDSMAKNAARIKDLEKLMNERNHVVAKAMKDWPFLEPMCGGLPLAAVLPAVIDRKDPLFFDIIYRRKALLRDPLNNQQALKAIEKEMDAYLAELGSFMKDYPFLDPFPEGMTLARIFPELRKRDEFVALQYEREQLMGSQFATPYEDNWEGYGEQTLAKIADAEHKMNAINVAVAYDYYAFLTRDPEDLQLIPEVLPTLKTDYLFGKKERKRRYLRNKLNAKRVAEAQKAAPNRPPPDNKPLTRLEQQELLYVPSNAAEDVAVYKELLGLEALMDERNHIVAEALKYRPYLDKEPEGIAVGMVLVGLLEDPEFVKADTSMRLLLKDAYFDNATDPNIAVLKRKFAAERMQLRIDNYGKVENLTGAAADEKDSDDDADSDDDEDTKKRKKAEATAKAAAAAAALEKHHKPPTEANIEKDAKLKQLVERMNIRNIGLASALREYPYLDPVPVKDEDGDGMPLDSVIGEVRLDAEFAALEKERRAIFQTKGEHAEIEHEEKLDEIEFKMNERLRFVSRVIFERNKLLRPDEEYPFLDVLPQGIPVRKVIPYLKQDPEFMACDEERLALIADNKGGKWDAAIKGLEEAMNVRNHAVAATLKAWPFLDQFPEGIALSYVLPHLKIDPAFVELNTERLALLKDQSTSPDDPRIKALEQKMNVRNHEIAKAMKGYPFLDVMPEGIPLDIVFPVLVHDEEFKRSDAERMEVWGKLPDAEVPRGQIKIDPFGRPKKQASEELRKLEVIMNERNHEIARAMKAWPFLDQLPEGLTLAHVLPCLVLDAEFMRLDKDRLQLMRDPTKNKALIEKVQFKMNERNLAVARALKAYPFLDPLPEGIPVSSVIPFLERDEKVFVALNKRRLDLWKDPSNKANMAEIKKIQSAMNDRSHEFARAMLEYPFLDPMPEGIPLCYVLPLLKKDKAFTELDKERLALIAADPVKYAAKIADIEVKMNERNLEVARMLKAYPFLCPMPEGLPLCYVLPILQQDDIFLAFDAERIRLSEDPEKNAAKIKEMEQKMDDRSHEIARELNQYPFLDPVPEGVILSRVLPILKQDDVFLKLDKKRLELMSDRVKNAAAIKQCEKEMNDRSHEIARMLKQYPFLDPLPHGIPLSAVFPVLKHDPEFRRLDAERMELLGKEPTDENKARIKALEVAMNERNLAIALMMKEYPFLDPIPEGLPISIVLPVLKEDDEFKALDKERLELMADPDANAGKIREIELKMDERNHYIAKILKLLMDEYPFLTPYPEGLSLACVVWPHLSVDAEFCDLDHQRRTLLQELLTSPTASDSGKRDKITLLEELMDERNHIIARMLKAEAARKNNKDTGDDDWNLLPPGLLEATLRTPYQRKAFPTIKSENASDDRDRWIDVDFNKRNTDVVDWCKIRELYEGPRIGDVLLPETLAVSQFEHGITPECSFLVAVASVLQHDPAMIRNLFVTKEVRQDGRYTFQFYRWDRWVRVEVDEMIPMVRDEPLFVRSPTCHWWPLLLEKAYAKLYGSYQNIINGSTVEALQDITAYPVINHALSAQLRATNRLNFQKSKTWRKLAYDLNKKRYAMAVSTKPEKADVGCGLKNAVCYGIRKIHFVDSMNLNTSMGKSKRGSLAPSSAVNDESTFNTRPVTYLDDLGPSSMGGRGSSASCTLSLSGAEGGIGGGGANSLFTPAGATQSFDSGSRPQSPSQVAGGGAVAGRRTGSSRRSHNATTPPRSPSARNQISSAMGSAKEDAEAAPLIVPTLMAAGRHGSAGAGNHSKDGSARAAEDDEEDDLSHIILELYSPHRKATYNGPYRRGDSEMWTEEVKRVVFGSDPNASTSASVAEDVSFAVTFDGNGSSPSVIYVPLDVIMKYCGSLPMCYVGAVKKDPFFLVEAWTKATAGGNPSNHTWRKNPLFPIQNKTDKPMTIVAQIKQPDQRERQDILALLREGKANPLNDGHPDVVEIAGPKARRAGGGGRTPAALSRANSSVAPKSGRASAFGTALKDLPQTQHGLLGVDGNNGGGGSAFADPTVPPVSSAADGEDALLSLEIPIPAPIPEEEMGFIHYHSIGITMVEQQPPPQIDYESFDYDTQCVLTHLLVPNVCRFVHKGLYMTQRDVANEITLPPRSQCYLVPSTLEAGTIGSFLFSVFIPSSTADEGSVEMVPIDVFPPMRMGTMLAPKERKTFLFDVNVRGGLRSEEAAGDAADEAKRKLQEELNNNGKTKKKGGAINNADADGDDDDEKASSMDDATHEDIHLLLHQDKAESKQGLEAGDALMDDFMAIIVQGPINSAALSQAVSASSSNANANANANAGTPTVASPTSTADGSATVMLLPTSAAASPIKAPRLVGSMVKGMNYREVAALFQARQSGTYACTVICAKAAAPAPVTLNVYSFPGLTYGLRALDGAPPVEPPYSVALRRRGNELRHLGEVGMSTVGKDGSATDGVKRSKNDAADAAAKTRAAALNAPPPSVPVGRKIAQPPPGVLMKKAVAPPPGAPMKKMVVGGPIPPPGARPAGPAASPRK